ncbi:MAG: Crp/Fnr family transcriptional regulator, partial [Desulfobulbia bacterium]
MMVEKTELILANLGFTAEESNKIIETGVICFHPRNSIVLASPFTSESLYIILEGGVQVLALNSDDKEVTIAHYKNGEYFVGIEFSDVPHMTSVRAIEPSRLLELRMNWLKALLPQASTSANRVIENMLKGVGKLGEKLSESIQHKQAITEILGAICTSPSDLNPLLATVAENAAKLCDAIDASIMQVENDHLKLVAQYGTIENWSVGEKRRLNRNWVSGRAVVDCKPVHVLDLLA